MDPLNSFPAPVPPRFGVIDLKKATKALSVSLNFLYAKIMEGYSTAAPPPDITRLSVMGAPGAPLVVNSVINPVTETVTEIALTHPDSPFIPIMDVPGFDVHDTPKLSPSYLFGTAASVASKLARGIFPLIPPFLYELINGEEKHLQNIKVEITATSKKKIYQIGFGKTVGTGVGIALEVVAGRPIKLLHDREAAKNMDSSIDAVFPTTSVLDRILPNYAGPNTLSVKWKHLEPHTECIIIVEDPDNYLLKDGQMVQYIPLSEHEGFKIVHRDPTLIKNPFGRDHSYYDYFVQAEASDYTSLSSVSVKLKEPMAKNETSRTETFSLPFDDDPKKANDYYLEITQYQ
jgi:hypothetical protein